MEQTEAGTGNVYLLDIDIADAKAIGRRVNAHMISLRGEGDTRSHDNLRADILTDLILGSDPANGGRGLVEMRVSMTTLAGLDHQAAEIPGMGPVIADVARRFADLHPKAEWQATVTDDHGEVAAVVTTSRRPTKTLSRHTESTQPVCSFPGLSDAGRRMRLGPPPPLGTRRGNLIGQRRTEMPPRPHPQRPQMETPQNRRPRPLDQPPRPHLHHRKTALAEGAQSGIRIDCRTVHVSNGPGGETPPSGCPEGEDQEEEDDWGHRHGGRSRSVGVIADDQPPYHRHHSEERGHRHDGGDPADQEGGCGRRPDKQPEDEQGAHRLERAHYGEGDQGE